MAEDKVKTALKQLDPSNDQHWTAEGLPRIDTVKFLAKDSTLTRDQITAAWPELNRATFNAGGDTKTEGKVDSGDQSTHGSSTTIASSGDPATPAAAVDSINQTQDVRKSDEGKPQANANVNDDRMLPGEVAVAQGVDADGHDSTRDGNGRADANTGVTTRNEADYDDVRAESTGSGASAGGYAGYANDSQSSEDSQGDADALRSALEQAQNNLNEALALQAEADQAVAQQQRHVDRIMVELERVQSAAPLANTLNEYFASQQKLRDDRAERMKQLKGVDLKSILPQKSPLDQQFQKKR